MCVGAVSQFYYRMSFLSPQVSKPKTCDYMMTSMPRGSKDHDKTWLFRKFVCARTACIKR